MTYKDNQFITPDYLYWPEILRKDIPKSGTALQPIYECFTNALEAIRDKQKLFPETQGEILIKIFCTDSTNPNNFVFSSISIEDNGIGFNDEQFKRFNTYRDVRKNYKNLGSGRIQYVHYFDSTVVKSVFEQEGKCFEREFSISKNKHFLSKNAIVKHRHCKTIAESKTGTTVVFKTLLEKSETYNSLNEMALKGKLLERYIHYFCYNKNQLPNITIEFYIHSELKGKSTISKFDIPSAEKTQPIKLQYSRKGKNGIEKTDKTEEFIIDAFKVANNLLKENKLNLVSKGEVIEESGVTLDGLAGKDNINGYKYLFLVSSNYIDTRDTPLRGVLNIQSKEDFFKNAFEKKDEIFLEEIQDEVNKSISAMYPEIEEVKQKHQENYAKLKEMFLLDEETAKNISVNLNDSENRILEKFYEAEAKKAALYDASLKDSVDKLGNLDTTKSSYQDELIRVVDELVKTIPLQNKKNLTHYVARRKMVLELFQKILDNETNKLSIGGRIDEDVLHNLIFQQSSNDPLNSDLWLINEEYIYFKGVSEGLLGQIKLNGSKILKESLSPEEESYRTKQGGDARLKRTDILLFPDEAKCIIIELKAPGENISEHLNQINRYASLINNLSSDTLKFNTFYGYLIGESINADDIIDNDSDFKNAYNLGYIFRPFKRIVGKFGRNDGSLYTEIIKYSTLLERAKLRNKIFIDKLK